MDADQIGAAHQRTLNILGNMGSDPQNPLHALNNASDQTIFGEMGSNSALQQQSLAAFLGEAFGIGR